MYLKLLDKSLANSVDLDQMLHSLSDLDLHLDQSFIAPDKRDISIFFLISS